MDLKELTRRMDAFVEEKGWYADDSPRPQTARNLAVSLVLEASEVLECFQWSEDADSEAVAGELADVILYVLQIARVLGIDPETAVLEKLEVNRRRTWPAEPRKERP